MLQESKPTILDFVFIVVGIVLAAIFFLMPEDFILFRFFIFSLISFQFGSRYGLISAIPIVLVTIFLPSVVQNADETTIFLNYAMIYTLPVLGFLGGLMKSLGNKLDRYIIFLTLAGAGIVLQLYFWAQKQPAIIQTPFIFLVIISIYFFFKYKRYINYIKSIFWTLFFYYISSFIVYLVISRFSLGIKDFYESLVFLLPGDILSVFLVAVLIPQIELLINSFKSEKKTDETST